jgi:hypothetical protein
MTAKLIKDNLDGWKGHAALYSVENPPRPECSMLKAGICDHCLTEPPAYIIISSVEKAIASAHGGPEAKAFPANEHGEPECMATFAEVIGTQSHQELLQKMGLAWKQ